MNPNMDVNRLTAHASAKIILCGEHAVVHGAPAIAIPVLELQSSASLQPGQDNFCIFALDTNETITADQPDHPLMVTVLNTLAVLGVEIPKIHIMLESTLPIGSGLGSGASVSTAIVKLLFKYYHREIDYAKINDLVYQTEKLFHGTPSGIDNTVIVYGQPVYFQQHQPFDMLYTGKPFNFIIADSGVPSSTKKTVSYVKSLYEADPQTTKRIMADVASVVKSARDAIQVGDQDTLGKLMNRNQSLLRQLGVSTSQLDTLIDSAKAAGALGAKLSGGGGGGNVIALVHPASADQVVSALLQAGATRTIQTTLQESQTS